MKRLTSFIAFITFCFFSLSAQQSIGTLLMNVDKPKKLYWGQIADNMRDHTGTGMQLEKSGNIYIGDFRNGKYAGLGMYILAPGKEIKDLPGTTAFVGNWIDGKMNGKGTCYGADGEIIYSGMFADNEPTEVYPMTKTNNQHYFSDVELNLTNEYYLGEMLNGKPDGFGIFILPDGARSVGRVKSGHRFGISAIIYNETEWMVVNYSPTANSYEVIATTDDVKRRKATYDEIQGKINQELFQSMMGLMSTGLNIANQYVETKNGGSGVSMNGSSFTGDAPTSGGGNRSSSPASKSKGNDCGSAWMSAKRAYSDYESQLVPNGARTATNESDRRSIKSKMKKLRQTWEARGCPFTKSPYED